MLQCNSVLRISVLCAFTFAISAAPVITEAYLAGQEWRIDLDGRGSLKFEGSSVTRSEGPGGEFCSGGYAIAKSKITLTGAGYCSASCVYELSPQHPVYEERIRCGESESRDIYYSFSRKRKPDSELRINGVDVIILAKYSGRLTTPAVFRNAPSKKGQPIQCDNGSSPLREGFTVLGRTKQKIKVDKWQNYWYLVETSWDPEHSGCPTTRGWVFGEFVGAEK